MAMFSMLANVLRCRPPQYARCVAACLAMLLGWSAALVAEAREPLAISWQDNYLTVSADWLPGPVSVHYLEAYCRAGSTDREWSETVIPHTAELLSISEDGSQLVIRDRLADGVVVRHVITARTDEIEFRIRASNPTDKPSQAHWAQPCIRLDKFLRMPCDDPRALVPAYARHCFLHLEGGLTRLPTKPWAREAFYTPGQVYCPQHVDRDDVNPRPLSEQVPASGLCGCYGPNGKLMFGVCFEPYQEIFQGVICCLHNDFRLGGLAPGETKEVRGKFYFVRGGEAELVRRHARDFPEQVE